MLSPFEEMVLTTQQYPPFCGAPDGNK